MDWVFRGVKVEVAAGLVPCDVGVQNINHSGFRSLLLSLTTALLRGCLCWGYWGRQEGSETEVSTGKGARRQESKVMAHGSFLPLLP